MHNQNQYLEERARAALAITPAEDWKQQAACEGLDVELFFPASGGTSQAAQECCESCPVQLECLQTGLYQRHGIWGGSSERTRRIMRQIVRIAIDGSDPI